jgi:hypothetical protein
MKYGVATYHRPKLNLKINRETPPAFGEIPKRPLKRIWTNGLSSPPSPTTEGLANSDMTKSILRMAEPPVILTHLWMFTQERAPDRSEDTAICLDTATHFDLPEL